MQARGCFTALQLMRYELWAVVTILGSLPASRHSMPTERALTSRSSGAGDCQTPVCGFLSVSVSHWVTQWKSMESIATVKLVWSLSKESKEVKEETEVLQMKIYLKERMKE